MTARCDRLLAENVADPDRRKAIMADPRDLHRELFASSTPADYPEYTGTYRSVPPGRTGDGGTDRKGQSRGCGVSLNGINIVGNLRKCANDEIA